VPEGWVQSWILRSGAQFARWGRRHLSPDQPRSQIRHSQIQRYVKPLCALSLEESPHGLQTAPTPPALRIPVIDVQTVQRLEPPVRRS
jgi:hypothetical protein